jgi:hypothetical protein
LEVLQTLLVLARKYGMVFKVLGSRKAGAMLWEGIKIFHTNFIREYSNNSHNNTFPSIYYLEILKN